MLPTKPLTNADVSTLMDGHLDAGDAPAAIAGLVASEDAQSTWHRYHLIGDIIRSDQLAPSPAELEFAQRVMDTLDKQYPVVSEPAGSPLVTQLVISKQVPGANSAQFRTKAAAGALGACLIALLIVGFWQVEDKSATPQTVAVQSPGEEDRPVMNRDPELDALLSAHEQMGGHSALQTPSGFLRNATFDRSKP